MTHTTVDRNLLLGMLAVERKFVGREVVLAAARTWVATQAPGLGQVLLEQGALTRELLDQLEVLVQERAHGTLDLSARDENTAFLEELRRLIPQPTTSGIERRDGDPDATKPSAGTDPFATKPPSADAKGAPVSENGPVSGEASKPEGSRYRILRPHARGGLGEVYVAYDEELKREVALKEIQSAQADNPNSRARFLLEAEVTGRLEHPGIVPVYGLGHYEDGRPYYAMRFIHGDSLDDAISRYHRGEGFRRGPGQRTLELRKLLRRFLDICNAIDYAHSQGVLHRDLKPGNVMLGKYGETLVVDWGLAKTRDHSENVAEQTAPQVAPTGSALTQTGSVIGTPAFMSPEQAAGDLDRLGAASDVYSLGATLYCLLTGQAPFAPADNILLKVRRGEFPAPRRVKRSVPAALEAICLKAMALRPEDRYPSPSALANDIEDWLADEPVSALPESWLQRLARWMRRHRTWTQAAGAALLSVTAVSIVAMVLVDRARRREHVEHQRAERMTAGLACEQGLTLCDQGDISRGMLWMSHSLLLTPPDATDFHHYIRANLAGWYPQLCPLQSILPHQEDVRTVAFSPDGKLAATGSDDTTAVLWDRASGYPKLEPLRHPGPVVHLTFCCGGTTLHTVCNDGTASEWGVADGTLRRRVVLPHPHVVTTAAASPDGQTIVTGCDNIVQLWDFPGGQPLGRPLYHKGRVRAVAFRPDGKAFASAGDDWTARLWEAPSGEPLGAPLRHNHRVLAIAFRPDGNAVVTGTADNRARVWELPATQPLPFSLNHQDVVLAVAYSADAKYIVTGSADNMARVWEMSSSSGKPLGHSLSHLTDVLAVALSPDGRVVLTGSNVGRLWDVSGSKPLSTATLQSPLGARAMALSDDGQKVVTGHVDNTAQVWEATTGRRLGPALQHDRQVDAVAFCADGHAVVTGSCDDTARVWSVPGGEPLTPPLRHRWHVRAVALSPDGKTVLTGSDDRTARLWEVPGGKPLTPPLEHPGAVEAVAFSPDGKLALTGCIDRNARLWHVPSGEPFAAPIQQEGQVLAAAFRADGKAVVIGSNDNAARLWEIPSGKPLSPSLTHLGRVLTVAFSPDGSIVATGNGDKTARLWQVNIAKPLGPALLNRGHVLALGFAADAKTILTGDDRKDISRWHVPVPVAGDTERILLWIQVVTGMELDEKGSVRVLDAAIWQQRRERLNQLGGPPL